ncbi:hypothetical protein JHK82_025361 [Glycine max]|nr:hypothetical protein JHK85_025988 [Glycine max]KAG5134173.1 hypothetical protein JHK82_025361 [Glycine max]
MSGKASVSKELHAKHTKILEGLVKLPDNRECADCRTKNSPESWSAYIKGSYSSFLLLMGNAKSNKHWEAELPPNFDRNGYGVEKFIRSKYVEKRWASKGGLQPASKSAEIIFNSNKSPASGAKSAIQNRRLSLEESILVKHMAQIRSPITRSHEGSSDLQKKNSPPPIRRPSASFDFDYSRGKNNGTVDHFGLLSIHDSKQDFSTTPPSWTTFDSDSRSETRAGGDGPTNSLVSSNSISLKTLASKWSSLSSDVN